MRSLFVARTPSVEARSPDCRSNVENAPVIRQSVASSARRPRLAGRSHYVVISRDGRKLVTRIGVVAIATQPVHRLQIRPIVHNLGGGSLYHAPKLHPGPCSSVGVRSRTDRHTDRQTDTHRDTHTDTETRVTTIHFASSTTHAKCNE